MIGTSGPAANAVIPSTGAGKYVIPETFNPFRAKTSFSVAYSTAAMIP